MLVVQCLLEVNGVRYQYIIRSDLLIICSFLVANKWLHEQGQEFLRPCNMKYKSLKENYESYLETIEEEDIVSYYFHQNMQKHDDSK